MHVFGCPPIDPVTSQNGSSGSVQSPFSQDKAGFGFVHPAASTLANNSLFILPSISTDFEKQPSVAVQFRSG